MARVLLFVLLSGCSAVAGEDSAPHLGSESQACPAPEAIVDFVLPEGAVVVSVLHVAGDAMRPVSTWNSVDGRTVSVECQTDGVEIHWLEP